MTRAAVHREAARSPSQGEALRLPARHDVLGVPVSASSYAELVDLLLRAARQGTPLTVDHLSVHGLAEAAREPGFRTVLNGLDVVAPDGQPVRWALNRLW